MRSSELPQKPPFPPANPCKLRYCAERWPSGAGTTPLARRKLQHLVFRLVFAKTQDSQQTEARQHFWALSSRSNIQLNLYTTTRYRRTSFTFSLLLTLPTSFKLSPVSIQESKKLNIRHLHHHTVNRLD